MRFYLFIILACIGLVMGAKQLLSSLMMGTSHDVITGSAMFVLSLIGIITIGISNKSKGKHF